MYTHWYKLRKGKDQTQQTTCCPFQSIPLTTIMSLSFWLSSYLCQRGYVFNVFACLLAKLCNKYSTNFNKIRWKSDTWATKESLDLGGNLVSRYVRVGNTGDIPCHTQQYSWQYRPGGGMHSIVCLLIHSVTLSYSRRSAFFIITCWLRLWCNHPLLKFLNLTADASSRVHKLIVSYLDLHQANESHIVIIVRQSVLFNAACNVDIWSWLLILQPLPFTILLTF